MGVVLTYIIIRSRPLPGLAYDYPKRENRKQNNQIKNKTTTQTPEEKHENRRNELIIKKNKAEMKNNKQKRNKQQMHENKMGLVASP